MIVRSRIAAAVVVSSALIASSVSEREGVAQSDAQSLDAFSTSGTVTQNGQAHQYRVEHLPASSFPALPTAVAAELNRRECLIPQTYQAHGPENVIHGSFRQAGERDALAHVDHDGGLGNVF